MKPFLHYIILAVVCTSFLAPASAQQIEYEVTHYDETNGLESNIINAMLQDSRGYLWFGTADGLCRFDGYNFQTFRKKKGEANSIPGNYINKLVEDHDGKIWIGLLKDGISCYDPSTGQFKNYDLKKTGTNQSLVKGVSLLYVDKDNQIWAGLWQKGLIKLNKETGEFSNYNIIADTSTFYSKEFKEAYNNVYAMYQESSNKYWLATHDGLYKFNSTTGSMRPVREAPLQDYMRNGSPGSVRNDLFSCLVVDKEHLWMGAWAGGLTDYNINTNAWKNFKPIIVDKNIATANIISDLETKSPDELWVASLDKGFGVFNKRTSRFNFFNDSAIKNLPVSSCSQIMLDKQNNIWLSFTEGLFKIRQIERNFALVPLPVSRSDNGSLYGINALLEESSGKYIVTGTSYADGLHVTSRQTGETKIISFDVMPKEENSLLVMDLLQDSRNNIWVLTRDFIYWLDLQSRQLRKAPQPVVYIGTRSNYLTGIDEDKNGNMWITTARNGVFCYDVVQKTYKHFYNGDKVNPLPSNVIVTLAVDGRGRVWIGGSRGCLGYFTPGDNTFINLDKNGKPAAQPMDYRVNTLYADHNGNIYSGTDGGLYYYDTKGNEPVLKQVYNNDNGLRGDIATSIQEDAKGDIWCTTGSSLCKIDVATGNIIAFKKQDGIDMINLLNGLHLFNDGKMAVYTAKGYYKFDPSFFTKKQNNIPAIITSFKIDDKENFFDSRKHTMGEMQVPASANVVSFEFAAIDFDRPDKQQYIYKLEGFDKDWVNAGQRRYAGYANLPGGHYVFKVKAFLPGNDLPAEANALSIYVAEPFYKTWPFILSVILVALLSTYLFYRYKLNQQREIHTLESKAQLLEKEKALVMYEGLKQQLNPHFLFNSLSSLNSLIRYNQKQAGEFLEKLSAMYRYILKSRDHETVTLAEEIKFANTYVNLQQTRFEKGLSVNIDISPEYDYRKIAPVTLQNLFENAIKHNIIDEESPLVINVFVDGDYIVVKNNLQKKNYVESSNKQGLSNLISLYKYLIDKPIIIQEEEGFYTIKIPLI